MAGDAVLIAPVSKQIPWYQGILQGILRFSGLETRFSAKKPPRCSHFSSNTRRQPDKTQSEHMFSAFGSPITSRSDRRRFRCGDTRGLSGRLQSLARRIGPIPGKTVASPAYLESHGIPKTPEELIDHACLMHGTESWRFVSGTSAAG